MDQSIEEVTYAVNDAATLLNLQGIDESGNPLPEDDPRAILHYRWMHELGTS